jgi:hypothetical protein
MLQSKPSSSAQPSIEIRIPLSATDAYMRMLHHFLESVQHYAGILGRRAKVLVIVAADQPEFDLLELYPWLEKYPVKAVWGDPTLFNQYSVLPDGLNRTKSYAGSLIQRLIWPTDTDIVILADADLLITGDFDKAISQSFLDGCVRGFIAHGSPFMQDSHGCSQDWWGKTFELAGLTLPELEYQHTGYQLMFNNSNYRMSPAYFNYGWIVCDSASINKIARTIRTDLDAVNHLLWDLAKSKNTDQPCHALANPIAFFRNQIAFTLSIYRNNLKHECLSITDNFPLHIDGEAIRALNSKGEEHNVKDVAVFHYLGSGEFSKSDFNTDESLKLALQKTDTSLYARRFQECLNRVHNLL